MKRIIDISVEIHPHMIVWRGDPPVEIVPTSRISRGDSANVSRLRLGSHTGTHIDPPYHFLEGGATVDALPLDVLVGDAFVADLGGHSGPVGPRELEAALPREPVAPAGAGGLDEATRSKLPEVITRLLLKTRNSTLWHSPPPQFPEDYVCLSPDGARWMVERGIRLVGTDFLSIEAAGAPGHPTHKTLLEAGVVVVEGLDLSQVATGFYELVCLPLKIVGGDGAPARAVLVER